MHQFSLFPTPVTCPRCGKLCKLGVSNKVDARPFRTADQASPDMRCAECIVVEFFKNHEFLMRGIEKHGIQMLRDERVQAQFTKVMQAGNSDLSGDKINWNRVVDVWEIEE